MIGINNQCENCRHFRNGYDDGQLFYDCEVSFILDETDPRDCPDWDENRWWEDEE